MNRWRLACLLGALFLASACATPIGVKLADRESMYRTLTSSVLSTGDLSPTTEQELRRRGLGERFKDDPEAVLAELRGTAVGLSRDMEFTLAELSFSYAEKSQKRDYYLASAVYAYAFLLPDGRPRTPSAVDPRIRLGADLYNLGLMRGLTAEGDEVNLDAGNRPLPFGQLDLTIDQKEFLWGGYRFSRFIAVAEFQIRGLRNRYRQAGVGVPLAAELTPVDGPNAAAARARIPPRIKVPVTAFVRIDDVVKGIETGAVHGRIELYPADEASTVEIAGRTVPLEQEPSATLAYMLEGAPVWDTEIGGFLSAHKPVFGDGLILLHPYQPDRIPVVLIHGTASSPARWAEMLNELENDPELRDHLQFWLFTYNTSNPILLSAMHLRSALTDLVNEVDPNGDDVQLHRMALIGHSQGGLLARLMVTDSGNRFWDNVSNVPLDELKMSPANRELLEGSMFFKPLPFVDEVIFIATPHRGSFRATGFVLDVVRRLVTLPVTVVKGFGDVVQQNPNALTSQTFKRVPTAVDNMSPNTPFIKTLSTSPIAPGVEVHSIIAVLGEGPLTGETDSVVRYDSAHLNVGTEKVVHSSHSTQATPDTIEEVRRILRAHVLGK